MKTLRLAVTASALLLQHVRWTVAFAPHLRLATRPRLGVKGETSLEDDLLLEQDDDRDTLQQPSFVEKMLQEKHAIDELMVAASRKGSIYESSLSDEDVQYYQEHHHHHPQERKSKTKSDVDKDDALNQSAFLGAMTRDAKALADLMKTRPPSKAQAVAAATTITTTPAPLTAATPTDDIYTRAATRLQQLAEASRDKRAAAKELAAAQEKARRSKKRPGMPSWNGPLTALSVLATGMGLGMAMNAPSDVAAIWDLNGMGTLDWSHLDVPSNWLDLTRLHLPAGLAGSSSEMSEQMSRQATDFLERVIATKDAVQYHALPVIQEVVLQRVADLWESLPTAQDLEAVQEHMWELAQNADQQVMQRLRDVHLSLPAVQMDNIVARVRDGLSGSTAGAGGAISVPSQDELMLKLNEANDWMAAQASAAVGNVDMSNIISSVDSAKLAVVTQLQNAQENMQTEGVREAVMGQVGAMQSSLNQVQDSLAGQLAVIMESVPSTKDVVVSRMNEATEAVRSVVTTSSIDALSSVKLPDLPDSFIEEVQVGGDAIRDLHRAAQDAMASSDIPSTIEFPSPSAAVEKSASVMAGGAQLVQEGIASIQASSSVPVPTAVELPPVNAAVQPFVENVAAKTTSSANAVDAFGMMGADDLKEILKSVAY